MWRRLASPLASPTRGWTASSASVPAATRRVLWIAVRGRRAYGLMRKHETPLQHGLSSQVLQMPEVREARKFFAEGKIGIAVENLARADEISSASGMPELSLLTSESLAYLHARSGDFSKEAHYRAQCAKASAGLQEKAPGISTDLTCFDCLHNSALTDIKCGRWNVATLVNARKVAMRVGNEGRGLMRMCDMTEIIASLDTLVSVSKSEHQPSSVNTEHTAALASRMTETLGDENGGERALNAAAYLVLASALDRLPQAATGSLRIDSLQACQKAVDVLAQADGGGGGDGGGVSRSEGGGGGMEAEVFVKVAALLHLSRIHMHNQKYKDADKAAAEKSAASDAVVAAESAATKHGLYAALCQLALVRKAMGDFVVAEGLLKNCISQLSNGVGGSSKASKEVEIWEMVALETATHHLCEMLDSMTFNSHSRKPEALLVREQFDKVRRGFPVTASAAARLRHTPLQHWYVSAFAGRVPALLIGSVPRQ